MLFLLFFVVSKSSMLHSIILELFVEMCFNTNRIFFTELTKLRIWLDFNAKRYSSTVNDPSNQTSNDICLVEINTQL